MFRFTSLGVLLLLVTGTAGAHDSAMIDLREWAITPRSGAALVQHPELSAVVSAALASPGTALELRYPGGDEGVLRASELRGWLVALGLDGGQIELLPGSADPDSLSVILVPRTGGTAKKGDL